MTSADRFGRRAWTIPGNPIENVVEIAGMEGEIVTLRDLFTYRYRGERSDGTIEGSFEPARSRPDFLTRAMRLGVDTELLETLGITGVAA